MISQSSTGAIDSAASPVPESTSTPASCPPSVAIAITSSKQGEKAASTPNSGPACPSEASRSAQSGLLGSQPPTETQTGRSVVQISAQNMFTFTMKSDIRSSDTSEASQPALSGVGTAPSVALFSGSAVSPPRSPATESTAKRARVDSPELTAPRTTQPLTTPPTAPTHSASPVKELGPSSLGGANASQPTQQQTSSSTTARRRPKKVKCINCGKKYNPEQNQERVCLRHASKFSAAINTSFVSASCVTTL